MDELRDRIYWWSLDLIHEGQTLPGIVLLLATWNFAYFRYHMRDFPLAEFERLLKDCHFEQFDGRNFETIDLSDHTTAESIKRIFESLAGLEAIRSVGATKIMHLMAPKVFVMWDTSIRKHYGAKHTGNGYLDFMATLQKMYKNGQFGPLDNNVTIPRAIDLYNIRAYPRAANKPRPKRASA